MERHWLHAGLNSVAHWAISLYVGLACIKGLNLGLTLRNGLKLASVLTQEAGVRATRPDLSADAEI